MWNIIEHCLLPQDYQFCICISSFLRYCLLKFWSRVKSKMEEWEFVEGPHYQSQSETGHNSCQSVDCPIYRNQSETEHSSQVTILCGFHHIQWVNLNHLPPSWLIGTWTYHSINQASIGDSTNMIAEWKHFRDQVELLLDGAYTGMVHGPESTFEHHIRWSSGYNSLSSYRLASIGWHQYRTRNAIGPHNWSTVMWPAPIGWWRRVSSAIAHVTGAQSCDLLPLAVDAECHQL